MIDNIKDFIDSIKHNPRIVTFDEAATKQAIILPILQCLGWNTHNIEEVMPESPVENRRVDYSLHAGSRLVLVEVKKTGEDIEKFEKQLLEYSFLRGSEFSILTNGVIWCFYLPMKRGVWENRKFESIDLIHQDSLYASQRLADLLSKSDLQNGNSSKKAEDIYRKKIILESLPIVWNNMIKLPSTKFNELISEMTELACGYRAENFEISDFLSTHEEQLLVRPNEQKQLRKRRKRESSGPSAPIMVAVNIPCVLDGIAGEYLKQSKQSAKSSADLAVYFHPEYLLEMTVRKTNSSNVDQIEFIATSKQFVYAFEAYCKIKKLKNPYKNAYIFGTRVNKELNMLSENHWTIMSKSNIAPYFKRLRGEAYWKFVKTK
ncbi:MAG: hypothetical protein M0Z89_13715 [Nitrospiraceae bacterium]|nr:hypothetical protein [Nitrospiraceae bacterium]